jgi:pimeloyl-ACP methyl ester carboxylesterase
MVLGVIRWGATIIAGLLLLLAGISALEEVTLGGVKQWIFIRGRDRDNPILIFLHGGPGVPFLGMPSARVTDIELIKHFTVVHWDQRGAGKSYSPDIPVDSMTFNRLVEDCNELIYHVLDRLDAEKVFVVAHSGGTVIGLRLAHRYPEKIHAYVGVAQIVDDLAHQRISYDFIVGEAEKSGNQKILDSLKAIGPPPFDSLAKFTNKDGYVSKFGGIYHGKGSFRMWVLGLSFITSPEYSLLEGVDTLNMKGFEFTMNAIYDEYKSVNLTEEIRSIRAPIYFFEGRFDMAIPLGPVEKFYDGLDAEKGKHFIIFEKSGHFPMVEEKERYLESLIDLVLKESQANK